MARCELVAHSAQIRDLQDGGPQIQVPNENERRRNSGTRQPLICDRCLHPEVSACRAMTIETDCHAEPYPTPERREGLAEHNRSTISTSSERFLDRHILRLSLTSVTRDLHKEPCWLGTLDHLLSLEFLPRVRRRPHSESLHSVYPLPLPAKASMCKISLLHHSSARFVARLDTGDIYFQEPCRRSPLPSARQPRGLREAIAGDRAE